jgi:hypothetical protein
MSLSWRSLEEARELGFAKQNLTLYETALEQIAREPIMDSVTAIRMRAAAVAALRQGGHFQGGHRRERL